MLTFQPHSCYSWINMRQLILCLISFHAFPFRRCHHKTVVRPGQVWDICDTEYNTDNWDLYDLYDICSEWWGDLTWAKKPLRCCDIWDTDYNTDNWEPEFMTIFVAWQLRMTVGSIRNSCYVLWLEGSYSSVVCGTLPWTVNFSFLTSTLPFFFELWHSYWIQEFSGSSKKTLIQMALISKHALT